MGCIRGAIHNAGEKCNDGRRLQIVSLAVCVIGYDECRVSVVNQIISKDLAKRLEEVMNRTLG
jgi:hypothetical protein